MTWPFLKSERKGWTPLMTGENAVSRIGAEGIYSGREYLVVRSFNAEACKTVFERLGHSDTSVKFHSR